MIKGLQIYQLSDILQSPKIQSSSSLVYFKQNQIRINIACMNKQKAYDMHNILQQRLKRAQKSSSTYKLNWRAGQLQFIFYILDKYCFLKQKALQQLNQEDWETLTNFFPGRQTLQCKYKILSLRKYSLQQHPWSQVQEQVFSKIVSQQGLKWDIVSKKLHQIGKSKIFRNSKQCRQHYLCFINPQMKKGIWNNEQDYLLLCLYLKYGRKWAKMSRIIKGRNQNAIKNRFFLLIQSKYKNKKSEYSQKINVNLAKQYLIQTQKMKQAYKEKLGLQKFTVLQNLTLDKQQKQIQDSLKFFESDKKQMTKNQIPQISSKIQYSNYSKLTNTSPHFEDQNYQILSNNGDQNQNMSFMKSEQFLNFLAF